MGRLLLEVIERKSDVVALSKTEAVVVGVELVDLVNNDEQNPIATATKHKMIIAMPYYEII